MSFTKHNVSQLLLHTIGLVSGNKHVLRVFWCNRNSLTAVHGVRRFRGERSARRNLPVYLYRQHTAPDSQLSAVLIKVGGCRWCCSWPRRMLLMMMMLPGVEAHCADRRAVASCWCCCCRMPTDAGGLLRQR